MANIPNLMQRNSLQRVEADIANDLVDFTAYNMPDECPMPRSSTFKDLPRVSLQN